MGKGSYVEPSKATVTAFLRARVDQWEAAGNITARTSQRYRQLVENQIVPHLGDKALQKLQPLDIEAWHTTLRNGGRVRGKGGLAARTIGHAHRVLGKALRDAARNGMVSRSVASEQSGPKVDDNEMAIVQDVTALVDKLRDWRLGTVAMVSLFTGARLGEVLALRWNHVDLDKQVLRSGRRWNRPRRTGSASSPQRPGPAGVTSHCPTSWWTPSRPPQGCARATDATWRRAVAG